MMVLYGLGTTIGAGIYALIGEIAGTAGVYAPLSFLVACALAGFTALSFAELAARFPRAGAAAMYIQEGFASPGLARGVGLLVVTTGIVSSAALVNGFTGYAQVFVDFERSTIVVWITLGLAVITAWGVVQSVTIAAAVTIIEVGGLVWIIWLNIGTIAALPVPSEVALPTVEGLSVAGVLAGSVLAFYAFIGFEDMVDMAEEVTDVKRTMPRAILLTLAITSVIYVTLMLTAVLAMPPSLLAASDAPLADLYQYATGKEPVVIGIISLFAIVNGAMIQMMMASRVLYGLASRQQIPQVFAYLHPATRTPLFSIVIVAALMLGLALVGRFATLAEATSLLMLGIFAAVNLALWRIKGATSDTGRFRLPPWFPLVGCAICISFVAARLLNLV